MAKRTGLGMVKSLKIGQSAAKSLIILKFYTLCYDQPFGMQRKYKKIREMFRDYNKNFFDVD